MVISFLLGSYYPLAKTETNQHHRCAYIFFFLTLQNPSFSLTFTSHN